MRFVSNETKEHGLYTGPGKAVWFHERETREPCPGNVENNVGQHSLLNFTSGTRTNKRETDDDDEKQKRWQYLIKGNQLDPIVFETVRR